MKRMVARANVREDLSHGRRASEDLKKDLGEESRLVEECPP